MARIDVHTHLLFPGRTLSEIETIFLEEMTGARIDKCILLAIDILPGQLTKVLATSKNYKEKFQKAFGHEFSWDVDQKKTPQEFIDENRAFLMRIATLTNERIFALCLKHPEKFIGFGSVDPARNAKEIRKKFTDFINWGFRGIKLLPTIQFFNPEEERLNLIYDLTRENEMILLIHTSCDPFAWQYPGLSEDANPKYLAKVAKNFPELKIIAAHLGSYSYYYPGIWFEELLQIMEEYKNVYADISALTSHPLFEPRNYLKRAIQRIGDERILFGSDFPAVINYSMTDAARAIDESDLSSKTKDRIMGGNAERILSN